MLNFCHGNSIHGSKKHLFQTVIYSNPCINCTHTKFNQFNVSSCTPTVSTPPPIIYTHPRLTTYLFHRHVPGSQSQSSHTHSGSSPPCISRCWDTGYLCTAWAALSSRMAWHPQLAGPRRVVGCLCSGHPWRDPVHSLRSRSSAGPSTLRWEKPDRRDPPANHQGRGCHPGPGSHSHQVRCMEYVQSWQRWCLKKTCFNSDAYYRNETEILILLHLSCNYELVCFIQIIIRVVYPNH